ncbi:MAG: hypothetical protein HYV77_00795 [Candidatus Wildermuthbacteria bacterium]|nr:hypothetical protein [Candidatus Wildermuthbacteria bacterium]
MDSSLELQKTEKQFLNMLEKAKVSSLILSEQEKNEGKKLLTEFMALKREEVSPIFFFKPVGAIALAIALFLTGGAGVVFAAQEALPGSPFYQVKMHVNERLRSVIALSPKEKARWEIERANLRLQEAEELSVRGKFDSVAALEIDEYLGEHIKKVQEISFALQESGKEGEAHALYSDLEVVLATHGKILGNLSLNTSKQEQLELGSTIANIQAYTEVMARDQEVANIGYAVSKKTAEQAMEAAEREMDETKLYIGKNKNKVGRYMRADIEAQLEEAEKFFEEGRDNVEAKRYKNSLVSFEKAVSVAKGAQILLETSIRIKKDLGPQN